MIERIAVLLLKGVNAAMNGASSALVRLAQKIKSEEPSGDVKDFLPGGRSR